MTDLIKKIPDFLIGPALAGAVWFGFNYAVLAPRAMGVSVEKEIMPGCISALSRAENANVLQRIPSETIPDLPGFDLKGLFRGLQGSLSLSDAKRRAICACASSRTTQAMKFDYAVHTASFRLIEPESVGNLRGKIFSIIRSQACGALPWLKYGR